MGETIDRGASDSLGAPTPAPYPPLRRSVLYHTLDAWRGLACVMIVLVHASFWAKTGDVAAQRAAHPWAARALAVIDRLDIGVPMFFVISGYCIAATADASRRRAADPLSTRPMRDYFQRRLRRIFPPYWAAVLLTILLSLAVAWWGRPNLLTNIGAPDTGVIPRPATLTGWQWAGNLTLTEEWRANVIGSPQNKFLGPAWTLCYEEQFYVVCGLLLLLCPRRFFTGALLITLATIPTFAAAWAGPHWRIKGFFFDGKWLSFAAGVFAYYHLNYSHVRSKWVVPAGLALGMAILAGVRYGLLRHSDDTLLKTELYMLLISGLFTAALLLLWPWDAALRRASLLLPLAFCGQMCYSLYLIHWPLAKLVGRLLFDAGVRGFTPVLGLTVPAVLVTSLVAAWVFHRLVERRFLNPPRAVSPRAVSPRAVSPMAGLPMAVLPPAATAEAMDRSVDLPPTRVVGPPQTEPSAEPTL